MRDKTPPSAARFLKKFLLSRSATASVLQTILVKVLNIGLSLACGIITARTFGPAGRGEQGAIGLWPWLVAGLSTIGVPAALRYHMSRDRDANTLMAATLVALVSGVLGAVIGAAVIGVTLGHRYNVTVVRGAQWMLLIVPFYALLRVFFAYYEARGDFTKSNVSTLTTPAFTLVTLLVLRAIHTLTPITANIALFSPWLFQTFVSGYRLRTDLFRLHLQLPARLRSILSYGIRGYGNDIMGMLSVQADQAVIIAFLTPSALGLYTVGLTASRVLNIFQDSLNAVLFPRASSAEPDAALDLVAQVTRITSVISVIAIAFMMVVLPSLITFFYGNAFTAAAEVTRILLLEAFFRGESSMLLQGFLATNRPGTMTCVQGIWLASTLFLLALLVPRLGINGAAFALVLSSLLRLLTITVCYPLVLHRPMPNLIPLKRDFDYLFVKIRMMTDR